MLNKILSAIETAQKTDDRQFVTALARGLSVLALIRENPRGISHQQLCEQSQLPKATISRILYTLQKLNLLYKDPENKQYCADTLLLSLGESQSPDQYIAKLALPLMRDFAHAYRVSVNLSTEEFGKMRYIQSIRSPAKITVQLETGSLVPLAQTSAGRAYYAAANAQIRKKIDVHLNQYQGENNLEIIDKIHRQIELFQREGYTHSAGEFSEEITAIATIIRCPLAESGIYALSASIPNSTCPLPEYIEKIAVPLKNLAQAIEKKLS